MPGIFHDFHQDWVQEIKHALNRGVLPAGYYAISEQSTRPADDRFIPDVLALQENDGAADGGPEDGGLLLAPPRTAVTAETDADAYRRRQNRVAVRRGRDDRVVAVIEVVSAGNKQSRQAMDEFVAKCGGFLAAGVHLLLVDLHPPTARDPDGVHGTVWDRVGAVPYRAPAGKPLTLAAYECDDAIRAYVEPVAVGDPMPAMPLFLRTGGHVGVPLEATYAATWGNVPPRWRRVIEPAPA